MLFNDLLVEIWQKYDTPYPELADLDDDLVEILRDPIMPGAPVEIPDDLRGLLWVFTQSWAALYGTVTLEVFGHIDPRMISTGVLFRQMFRTQAGILGLADELPRLEPLIVAGLGSQAERVIISSTQTGTSSPAGPWRASSKNAVPSLGTRFSSRVRAPHAFAICTNPAAGYTAPDVPIETNRSVRISACWMRSIS